MGMRNVYGLKTAHRVGCSPDISWRQVLTGSPYHRLRRRVAAAEVYATRLAQEDGVRYLDIATLKAIMARGERDGLPY